MKITKTHEEITYKRICTTHTFKMNGKEVRVYEMQDAGDENNQPEYDTEIDERDLKALTEGEAEEMEEYMAENLALKVGEDNEMINPSDIPF